MKLKLEIKKESIVVQTAFFDTLESLNSFLEVLSSGEAWGKPERWLRDSAIYPLSEEEKASAIETRLVLDMESEVTEYKFPSEYLTTIEDITLESEKQDRITHKINIGQITDKACNDVFMLIQGYNVERQLTSTQKNEMITLFAPALQAIQVRRPSQLKQYIASIVPDGTLVTEEMKEDILELLKVF